MQFQSGLHLHCLLILCSVGVRRLQLVEKRLCVQLYQSSWVASAIVLALSHEAGDQQPSCIPPVGLQVQLLALHVRC